MKNFIAKFINNDSDLEKLHHRRQHIILYTVLKIYENQTNATKVCNYDRLVILPLILGKLFLRFT